MHHLILNGLSIYNRNIKETREIYSSIFLRHDYNPIITTPSPKIIDGGAHIGLATIFFKKKYPSAEIVAIEANPKTFFCLKKNVEINSKAGVKTIWGALSNKTGHIPLYIDPKNTDPWSWDDSIIKNIWSDRPKRKIKKTIRVPAVLLSDFITSSIDFIKLDIEGAECTVLKEAEPKLNLVKSIILEFHPTKKTPRTNLIKIRNILRRHNFKIEEHTVDWALFISASKE